MSLLSVRLPKELERKLDEEVKLAHKKRGELVRTALSAYLRARERERFMSELERAARALAQDEGARRETVVLAEEFLPLENEALDIAEAREPAASWPKARPGKRKR